MASHVLPLPSLLLTTSPSFHSLHPAFLSLTNPSFHPQQLSIIVESIAGRITQTLDRLIALYQPDSLVVGTRGQRTVICKPWGWLVSVAVCHLYLSFYTYCRSVSFPTLPLPLPLHIDTRKKNNMLIQILRTNRYRLRVKILPPHSPVPVIVVRPGRHY